MFNYLLRRLISGVVVLGIVSAIVFGIFYILPADPARLSCGKTCSEELIIKIRHTLELDESLPVQYGRYIKGELLMGELKEKTSDLLIRELAKYNMEKI
jgi:peptide/nickel transport system permease protein